MANDSKLFTVAGTSTFNGTSKVRYANDLPSRIKLLEKAGNTNIVLVELPEAMSKADAVAYLNKTRPEGVDLVAVNAKETSIVTANTPKVPRIKVATGGDVIQIEKVKKTRTPRVKATTVENPVVEQIVETARKGGLRARAAKAQVTAENNVEVAVAE